MRMLFFFLFSVALSGKQLDSKYFIAIKKYEPIPDFHTYISFEAPEGRFYADPFLFKMNGINYIFYESYDYLKGVIFVVSLDCNGIVSEPQVALELPTHLSFPYVFSDRDEIYMLPETYRSRSISLFRCIEFPHQWERIKILLRGENYSDSILFYHEGYYWLFTAIQMEKLRIYYAKELLGNYLPHPCNKKGIKGRNAGSVFWQEGRLIRPVMDCSGKYGKAVIFKEIVRLTTDEFVEKELSRLEPNWAPGLVGTHSYSQSEDFIVYDGERLIPR